MGDDKRKAPEEKGPGDAWRGYGLATMIPILLAVSPMVGFFLGRWIGGKFGHADVGSAVGVFVGLAAGVRETVKVIRRMQ